MKLLTKLPALILPFLLAAAVVAAAAEPQKNADAGKPAAISPDPVLSVGVPLFSPLFADMPLATVGDDEITVRELGDALAGEHREMSAERKAGKKHYQDILNRLVSIRLVIQEARAMGIDELPEVRDDIDAFGKKTLREFVMERAVSGTTPDKAEAERFYQEGIKEFKIRSVFFSKPAAAEKAAEELKKSADFDATVKKLLESQEAQAADDAKFVKRDNLQLEIAKAVSEMTPGSVSAPITIESGYVVLRLDEVRTPKAEDDVVRNKANQLSLKLQKGKGLEQLRQELLGKYVKVDRKLLDKLDYEAKKTDLDKLMKDKRVLAEIKDEQPITVADMTKAFRSKFFHGIESAAETKEVNEKKTLVLDEMLNKRIFVKEALRLGLDKTDDYERMMQDYENQVLFDQFVRKAVIPGIKPTDAQLKDYYDAHIKEYSTPKMVRLSSIAFTTRQQAQKAVDQIKKGTSFKWAAEHADGLAPDPGEFAPPDGVLLVMTSLPDELRKSLDGAKQGDVKLYAAGKDRYHVVRVAMIVPEKAQPFEDKKKNIWEKVVGEEINRSLETWIAKLRAAYPVKIYLTGDTL